MLKGKRIYWIVILISVLLIIKVFLSVINSNIIEKNVKIQKEAEQIKVNTLDIIRVLHLMDLGVRGYALVPDDQIKSSYDSALVQKERVFSSLERSLISQQFEMKYFYEIRNSTESYMELCSSMMKYLKASDRKSFENIFKEDYGYQTWMDYKAFSIRIDAFENSIIANSEKEYQGALKLNYLLLTFLLVLILPTLFYTAFQTTRTFETLQRLKETEADKNLILANQKEKLEELVQERTEKIARQNEEINSRNTTLASQRDEIAKQHQKLSLQNRELLSAQELIQEQSEIIREHNVRLVQEVDDRTNSLLTANKELAQNVSQLEQFAFIVSHNLRAPVARILGLGYVLNHAKDSEEKGIIIDKLVKVTMELDTILNDLALTIQVKSMINETLQPVDLLSVLQKVESLLQPEILKCNGKLDFSELGNHKLNSIAAYVESIFYNLISNALKYRDPSRDPHVHISSKLDGDFILIEVQDNGLGIDLEKHERSIFNLYKRFHFHIEGKGLGLYLVKTQLDLLSSEISVKSKVGVGALFLIRLKHNNLS